MLKEKIPRRNDVALGIFSYLPTRSLSSKLGWHSQLRLLTTFSILQYGQDTLPHEVEFALQVAVVGSDGDDDVLIRHDDDVLTAGTVGTETAGTTAVAVNVLLTEWSTCGTVSTPSLCQRL